MKFVLIHAGDFLMGSADGEEDEQPPHEVRITNPFYMQTTEVTQKQWKMVMGDNPSHFKGENLPVENVSWEEAVTFAERLSEREGVRYRLPTEAEWEYACRAAPATDACTSEGASSLDEYAWHEGNSGDRTHPVAHKRPNTWGVFDMHGNVMEWCQDWYDDDYYPVSPANDPKGPRDDDTRVLSGSIYLRVLRGSSYLSSVDDSRSSERASAWPADCDDFIGFRMTLDVQR
jgi:formylglycine-generating enzyme required for sulfatase activity